MNPVYDLNLKAIRQADPELFNSLENAPESEIEILRSRNAYPIPRVNGVMIHSNYDPLKEAVAFVNSYESLIRSQDIILVMGYGFGYHVDEIVKRIKDDPEKFIFVIEPDVSFFKKSLELKDITHIVDRVTFIVGISVQKLFDIPGFYRILNAAQYMIGYKPAINVNEEYFVEFVKRRSSNRVEHLMCEADGNEDLLGILGRFDPGQELDLAMVIDSALSSVEQLTEAEKIFLLMGELGGRS